MKLDLCRWLGHRKDIKIHPDAGVNIAGCSRCGCLVKINRRQPCSYTTRPADSGKIPAERVVKDD